MTPSEAARPALSEDHTRLSARWQELFWALPPGEMRSKLRALEIDIGRALSAAQFDAAGSGGREAPASRAADGCAIPNPAASIQPLPPAPEDHAGLIQLLKAKATQAREVSDNMSSRGKWTMCIPVQEGTDSDTVIYALADAAERAADALEALTAASPQGRTTADGD